jgi:hypothetical protein
MERNDRRSFLQIFPVHPINEYPGVEKKDRFPVGVLSMQKIILELAFRDEIIGRNRLQHCGFSHRSHLCHKHDGPSEI